MELEDVDVEFSTRRSVASNLRLPLMHMVPVWSTSC